ncbi:MAG TPA: cupredoxin domain-containing protein [Actinomycetota bacterium]|nr:cupredoxin domain-containing protein [Actinomycetota bacterium]
MSDFRKRILEPLLLPLAAFAFVGALAFGLSRILLVTTANGASLVALVAALAVLLSASAVAAHGFGKPEKLMALFSFVAIVAGGSVFAATIGMRPVEHHTPEPSFVFTAVNSVSFEQSEATVETADELVIRFTNKDPAAPHNWGVQAEPTFAASPSLVEPGPGLDNGQSRDYILEHPDPGTYYYFCFIHPNMKGTLTITGEGGEAPPPPTPAESPTGSPSPTAGTPQPTETAPAGPAATSVDITAIDIAFDKDSLTLKAGTEIAVTFRNNDAGVPHNFAIYSVDLSRTIFDTKIFNGVETRTGTFTSPAPGTYVFRCDVHPQMKGDVVFE